MKPWKDTDNAEWFCQRAYAHLQLKNYSCAVNDAKKTQQLKPSLLLAFMRMGMAEYHLNHFEVSHAAFTKGHSLDGSDDTFRTWLKRCEEMMATANQNGNETKTPHINCRLW